MMAERCLSCMKTFEGSECPHCGYPNTASTQPHQLPVGTVLRERYQVGRVLGQGGFGITYLAWDCLLQKAVAIKEFFPGGTVQRNCAVTTRVECIYTSALDAYSRSTERFLREAQALVRFRDIPQVVDIQDFLRENNTAYIVMEYVKGVDLAKYVQNKGGRLSPEEAFRILRPVMEALAKVHKGGIVHRDISPDNIILDPLGGAKLLDFGAVRAVENPDAEKALEKSTEAILKRGFAPLEQYNSRGSLGPWTDVYAMCATVWYCLTGRVPEDASIRMTEGTDPDWSSIPGLSPDRQAALAKGIACRPRDRYPDMDSLLQALFRDEQPVPAPEIKPEPPKPEPPKPKPEPVKPEPSKPEPKKPAPREKKAAAKPAPGNGKGKKLWVPLVAGLALVAVIGTVVFTRLPSARYAKAERLMEKGDYAGAAALFEALEGYEDSDKQAKHCGYRLAQSLADQGNYREAAEVFEGLAGYSDSGDQARSCRYLLAEELFGEGRYEEAAEIYTALGTYGDSAGKLAQCRGQLDYPTALALLERKDYAGAAALFETMEGYSDSSEKLALCRNHLSYDTAQGYRSEGRYYDAATLFYSLGDFEDAKEQSFACWEEILDRQTLDCGARGGFALHPDGTVSGHGQIDESLGQEAALWQDIIDIRSGRSCIVGLKADGTVEMAGELDSIWDPELEAYKTVPCDLSHWRDIVAVYVEDTYVIGLKADGTVVTEGVLRYSTYNDQGRWEYQPFPHDPSQWRDIVSINMHSGFPMGLKADGTVVYALEGYEYWDADRDQYVFKAYDWSGWQDITAVSCGNGCWMGLKADGTVVLGRENADDFDVSQWRDIVSIDAGSGSGLKADGTVVWSNSWLENYREEISQWRDIVSLYFGDGYVVGLKADGTVVSVGQTTYFNWETGFYGTAVYTVSDWKDIVDIYPGGNYIMGLKSDGSLVLTGHVAEVTFYLGDIADVALPN